MIRRPFHAMTAAGAMAHHIFELAAGVGLVLQPELGLQGAAAFWGLVFSTWLGASSRGSSRWDRVLGLGAGLSLMGAGIHFSIWPWRRLHGVPILTEAEGLEPRLMPAYNAVLYFWALAAVGALIRETPRGSRRPALAALVALPVAQASARYHFKWVREQSRKNPAWWNRGVV